MADEKFSQWHGIDRNSIDWQLFVNTDKCIGCGLCVTSCGRNVYAFDYEKGRSFVANPKNCLVGCQTCANMCPSETIHFTDEGETTKQKAQHIVKETMMLIKVKKELNDRRLSLEAKPNK
jgi:formate hydrogenlyase subunit 6/NADH:ubiquinone oxidoreductase subunit I